VAEARLEELRRQQGAALLDGTAFDRESIASLEDEIEALTDAESEAVRRERSEAEARRQEQRRRLQRQLRDAENSYLAAVGEAEQGVRAFVDAVLKAQKASLAMQAIAHSLTGARTASALASLSFASRLSMRAGSVLSQIKPPSSRFGELQWRVGMFSAEDRWSEKESMVVASQLQAALADERTANGKDY
jgi:hypothetical protein